MKPILLLTMGLLNPFGLDCNARAQKDPPEIQFISAKESMHRQQTCRYQPEYEAELKALAATDTLYLVDRKYVNQGYCVLDTMRMIRLTSAEKLSITDAYRNGLFEVVDFNIYDEDGNLEYISGTGIIAHGDPAPPPAYYAYLFVTSDKKTLLPYNYGCFKVYDLNYRVSISNEQREQVDAVVKKYCPDSSSKSERYWMDMQTSRD